MLIKGQQIIMCVLVCRLVFIFRPTEVDIFRIGIAGTGGTLKRG